MTDFIARSNKGSWDFYCWRWISSCSEWVCAETQAALLLRDRGREGGRERERGRDCTYSIQKEVEKEFERREREEAECDSAEWEEEEEEEEGPSGRDKGGRNWEGDELRVSKGRRHQKVDEREKARGKLWESVEERGEQKKEDSSANQPRSDPLTAAVIQAGRGSLAQQKEHIRDSSFFHFLKFIYLGKDIRRLLGEERQEEDRGIRELLQPQSVLLQGKMDSDSGEQSDGDLSPGKTQDHSWKNNICVWHVVVTRPWCANTFYIVLV